MPTNFYSGNTSKVDNIFIIRNLIEDCYVNKNILHSIYRFRLNDEIEIKLKNSIYHEVTNRPGKIGLKLVNIDNKLIHVKSISIFITYF